MEKSIRTDFPLPFWLVLKCRFLLIKVRLWTFSNKTIQSLIQTLKDKEKKKINPTMTNQMTTQEDPVKIRLKKRTMMIYLNDKNRRIYPVPPKIKENLLRKLRLIWKII